MAPNLYTTTNTYTARISTYSASTASSVGMYTASSISIMQFTTIQELEQLDLTAIDTHRLRNMRMAMHSTFYHTKSYERTSDGRHLKVLVGEQLTRIQDELLNRENPSYSGLIK